MGKVCECGCFCVALYIKLGIILSFVAIDCDLLLPIIKYSKIEMLDKFDDNSNKIKSDAIQEYECYIYNDFYVEKEPYTAQFKIKQIKKFSTGLISLLFIQLALDVWYYGALIISCCCISEEKLAICALSYLILSGITSVLHLLFYILFSVYYFKGKSAFKLIENECIYFIFYKNCEKFFIIDIIFMFINFWLNCISWVGNSKEK